MTRPTHDELNPGLIAAALEAGAAIMALRRAGVKVEHKSDASPVTAADREAEDILVAAIAKAAPGVPVVAEEAMSQGREPETGELFFLVDPLDGTREFVTGSADFTVNVALVERGRPVWGLVYAPALGRLFVSVEETAAAEAQTGYGAPARSMTDLSLSPIRTAKRTTAGVRATMSGSHQGGEVDALRNAGLAVAGVERRGSSLKFGLIAAGEADIYPRFGETSAWDTAAGHAVVLAAGGAMTTLDGTDLLYPHNDENWNNPPFIVWGDPALVVPVRR